MSDFRSSLGILALCQASFVGGKTQSFFFLGEEKQAKQADFLVNIEVKG